LRIIPPYSFLPPSSFQLDPSPTILCRPPLNIYTTRSGSSSMLWKTICHPQQCPLLLSGPSFSASECSVVFLLALIPTTFFCSVEINLFRALVLPPPTFPQRTPDPPHFPVFRNFDGNDILPLHLDSLASNDPQRGISLRSFNKELSLPGLCFIKAVLPLFLF